MDPEKYQPAWGTMPPTPKGMSSVSEDASLRKFWISLLHAAALSGYQLPAKVARLTLIICDLLSFRHNLNDGTFSKSNYNHATAE
jgi:hypothetical protein